MRSEDAEDGRDETCPAVLSVAKRSLASASTSSVTQRAPPVRGIISDPTPRDAFKDLTDNDRAAVRRLGLASFDDEAVAS